jgi:dienelactone hydrolase
MQLTILAALLMVLYPQSPGGRVADLPAKPIPVAVLCGGDDGVTARLCDEVKRDLGESPDFTLEVAHKPRILIVRIPTNVSWKRVDGQANVLYRVEFSLKDERDLGRSDGSCREDRLNDCAAQIFSKTRGAIGQKQ